jgi:hypothetical protein
MTQTETPVEEEAEDADLDQRVEPDSPGWLRSTVD